MRLEAKPVIRGTRPTGKQGGRAEVRERKTNMGKASEDCGSKCLPRKIFLMHGDDYGLYGISH